MLLAQGEDMRGALVRGIDPAQEVLVTDAVALMATVVCEVHHHHDFADWTGFYRVVAPDLLKIGPYQGGHGCLVIPFARGVCGAAVMIPATRERSAGMLGSTTMSLLVTEVVPPPGGAALAICIDARPRAATRSILLFFSCFIWFVTS